MIVQLARSNAIAARSFLKLSMQVALKKPDAYFDLITNSIPDLDKEVLNDARLKRILLAAFKETIRQGVDHLTEEFMYLSTQWHVDSKQISCPISIWHGKEDRHAPFPLMQRFSRSLKQCNQTNWMDGAGHYMIFHHWDTIVENFCPKKKSGKSRLSCILGFVASLQIADWLPMLVLEI
jgi:pimeloyl-ACP methyl ester carboxylesterase